MDKQAKNKMQLIDVLYADFLENFKLFEQATIDRYDISGAYLNRNFGKTAIKRKIALLRQEMLNLERMIDGK